MNQHHRLQRVALIGDYLPRKCGIATFTHDVCQALAESGLDCRVVAVSDVEGYTYPPEVRSEVAEEDEESYRRAADFVNFSPAQVVCVQHEFGIFGGPAGRFLLSLLRRIRLPVVTQLHSILERPEPGQMRVMQELSDLSTRFIVMSERGGRMLRDVYGVAGSRIDRIPHGIPDMPFVDPNFYKDQFGVEGKKVLLTFGLISPGKGIEFAIRALPEVVQRHPEVVYLVLGATHPKLLREQGEAYRHSLERLAAELGVKRHVLFHNAFVDIAQLKEFLSVADIYLTPYLNEAQITSGTLAYAFGCGKAVISTPYWHAEELLGEGRGVLVPFRDSGAIAREVNALLEQGVRRHAMRKQAYLLGRAMTWNRVADSYVASFEMARATYVSNRLPVTQLIPRAPRGEACKLPELRLDHLRRLSDGTGLFQHAKYSFPQFREGYCTDDNARALFLMVALEQGDAAGPQPRELASTYAAFLNHAFIPEKRRFHNFLSFERIWLDEEGSDDCWGRALLALGACVGRSRREDLRRWGVELWEQVLPGMEGMKAPRGWALALLALHEYFRCFAGDLVARGLRERLTKRLMEGFARNSDRDWVWCEQRLTYGNARLPHALILSGRWANEPEVLEMGLRSLRWLMGVQTAPEGHFRPIGTEGFYGRGGARAQFDQQPLEAWVSVSACLEAWHATKERFWMQEAGRAFEWFLGRNDLGQALYDPRTGGCYDGLHRDGLNLNQGAESTLAGLLAIQEMTQVQNALKPEPEPEPEGAGLRPAAAAKKAMAGKGGKS